MSRISGFPTGFLSLLDAKTFGNSPSEVSDNILPTVDIGDLFLTTKQVGALQIVAAPANGINAGIVVPGGEVWRVHAAGVIGIFPVGATADVTVVAEIKGEGAIVVPLSDTLVIAPNTTRWITMKAAPFWLSAGNQLSVYLTSLGGAPTISVSALVSKLRA